MSTTPTAPPAPTKRLDFALALYNSIRIDKQQPLARHCALLAMAKHDMPMTNHQIGKACGKGSALSGTVESAVRLGFVTSAKALGKRKSTTYTLTSKGLREVKRLLLPPTP